MLEIRIRAQRYRPQRRLVRCITQISMRKVKYHRVGMLKSNNTYFWPCQSDAISISKRSQIAGLLVQLYAVQVIVFVIAVVIKLLSIGVVKPL